MARIESDPNYSSPTFSRATAATDPFKKEDVQSVSAALSTHDHSSGKGLPVAALSSGVAIPNGTITSGMILDGAVATVDVAPHAISQVGFVVGSTSGPTTTSTTYVDLPNMSVSLTTTGGDVIAVLVASFYGNTAGLFVGTALVLDSGGEVGGLNPTISIINYELSTCTVWVWPALTAGAHTFKGRWLVQTGLTATAASTRRQLLVMEMKR